jgi:site-specific recombinase XerD
MDPADWSVLRAFVASLRHSGISKSSADAYRSSLKQWLLAGGTVGHVDVALLHAHLASRRKRLAVNTVNADLKVLRRFYAFSAACGHCAPTEIAKIPKGRMPPARLPRTLSMHQIADVLTQPDPTTWIGFRDTVLLRVLADTGLKTSQVARLCVASVLDDSTLYVARYRQMPARYVPLSAPLHALLARYIERRHEVRPGKRSALFLTHAGQPLAERTICQTVSRHIYAAIGKAFGSCMRAVTGRPWQGHYPHELRASLAQHYLERGLDVVQVAQLMGYADPASVNRYAGINLVALRAAIARHPRHAR